MDNIKTYEKLNKKAECITYQLPNKEKHIMNKVLNIDPELRDLLPPLTVEEFQLLEENIKANGCLDPIITWTDPITGITYIIDGHNRYEICSKHNIKFQTIELGFKTKEDVIQWMVETQLGRRNLSALQRVEISEKYRPIYEKKAKENLKTSTGGSNPQPLPKSANPVNTRDALSKIAKVGHDTYNKAKKIVDLEKNASNGIVQLTEEQKKVIEKAKKDEIKVNTAFNELFVKTKVENKPKQEEKKVNIQQESNVQINKNNIISLTEKIEDTSNSTKEIINHLKKDKLISDYFNFEGLIDCTVVSILEAIDIADSQMFSYEPIDGILTREQQILLLSEMDKVIIKINEIKNKINNINLKGE